MSNRDRDRTAVMLGLFFLWLILIYLGALNDQAALSALR